MLFTVGYHGMTLEHLKMVMQKFEIDVLVDIRTKPWSRYRAEFNRPHLLRELGSRYVWKGNCLGGYSGIKQVGYNECLEWLAEVSRQKNVCIMCMEADPTQCHRDSWIARDMKVLHNVEAKHIFKGSLMKKGSNQQVFGLRRRRR